jgi:hypothetical protein
MCFEQKDQDHKEEVEEEVEVEVVNRVEDRDRKVKEDQPKDGQPKDDQPKDENDPRVETIRHPQQQQHRHPATYFCKNRYTMYNPAQDNIPT